MLEKRLKPEGNGASQLVQLIRQHGHNTDVDIVLGTVKAPPPGIIVRLDGVSFDLDADDLTIAGDLVERTYELAEPFVVNDPSVPHTHTLAEGKTFTVKTPLKAGDRVLVACMDAKQQYIVLDKAVKF